MATEEPQRLASDHKPTSPTPIEEMAVGEPVTRPVNGHAKSEEVPTQSIDTPLVNGETKSPNPTSENAKGLQNQQAFAANSNLPEQTSTQPLSDAPTGDDSEMVDVNGASTIEKAPSVSAELSNEVSGESVPDAVKSTPDTSATKEEPSETLPVSVAPTDSMDVDASVELPDVTSSAERGESTQDTFAAGDGQSATSPKASSQQPADLSKLDIKANEETAPTETDVSMADRPASPTKNAREREDDDPEERAAKRAKTEEPTEKVADSLVVASGFSPAQPTAAAQSSEATVPDSQVITLFQSKQLRQGLATIKKTKNGANFRQSVERLWPTLWNDYKARVDTPVDISLFESKLREDKYANYGDFKADVQKLYENALAFNGPDHQVTNAAASVRDQIFLRLPGVARSQEPSKPEKGKAQSTRHAEPRGVARPRQPSQPRALATATSPKPKPEAPVQTAPPAAASTTSPAFAVPPSGIPQIRRDSTRGDSDRPKRPIHPPKSRDLDYSSKPNSKKKLEPEQRFFKEVLEELKKPKYATLTVWFNEPVDPVALDIPSYFKVIKKPMDLGTMYQKTVNGEYKTSRDLEKDMKLMASNAETFNGSDHLASVSGKELVSILKQELAQKDRWMEKHTRHEAASTTNATAHSPDRSLVESEEESEAEADEDDGNEAIRNLQERMKEEQVKLDVLLGSKKPDLMMIEIQQSMVTMIQRKLVEEKTKFNSEDRKPKAKKKNSNAKSKPKPGASGAAGGVSKKLSSNNAAASKKAPSNHKKAAPKKRVIGPLEKAVIADGINELDGMLLTKAVELIKRDTGQNENDDGEMELDIDALSSDALVKLYDLIHKAMPSIRAEVEQRPEYATAVAPDPEPKAKASALPKSKKNKPMNKHEQERKIEQLRELKAQLQRHGSGSQEPMPADAEDPPAAETSEESDSEEE
ncbi:Uu.00g065570.m01.CDS01 [Anthostomella pinea]|uniref:Uu.00g065570.m01.CDS01 n=1 Tax=Anthostomella pinea TaxID=933095 RepID=A0AAI8VTR8_9PEZI|nr:Uu.00g065570.m01.CDS01 [Anthostomella pinea]